jgi:hypothetical protein
MVEWGLIHVLAGIICGKAGLTNKPMEAYEAIYGRVLGPDAADARTPKMKQLYNDFHAGSSPLYAGRILFQHAFNLFWTGVFALTAPAFIASPVWNRFTFMWCLVPYLLDWGYFLAIDVPFLGGVFPELQTYIVSIGLFCIGYGVNERWKHGGRSAPGTGEEYAMWVAPCLLVFAGLLQRLGHVVGFAPFGFLLPEDTSSVHA